MREHPWHLRHATVKHYQWFRNLSDLHELTAAWVHELKVDRASHLMTRGLTAEVVDNLWMLDSLSETAIDSLLDDTDPSDTLGRLEHTVWSVQAWTLIGLLERTPVEKRGPLRSILEQIAWKSGRQVAEKRWPRFSAQARSDLRSLLLTLSDSPMASSAFGENYIIRRAVERELEVELLGCPHSNRYPEVLAAADDLCDLHAHWIRGFIYSFNHQIAIESGTSSQFCFQRWTLPP